MTNLVKMIALELFVKVKRMGCCKQLWMEKDEVQSSTGLCKKLGPITPSSKKRMQLKSWKALKQQDYEVEYDEDFPFESDIDA